jgi:L,D-transpeptidase-like protein
VPTRAPGCGARSCGRSLPATEKRLWVLDLEHRQVLFHELVAHGRESGENEARVFSNDAGSHQSSLGVFRTGVEYVGEHGISLRLEGLEPGINDRAEERAIVLHGAAYVSEQFAARYGRLGRSFGCPVVRPEIADSLIHTIRDGTLLYASYPDSNYATHSVYMTP